MRRIVVFSVCVVIVFGAFATLTALGASHPLDAVDRGWSDGLPSTDTPSETNDPEGSTAGSDIEPGAQFVGAVGAHAEQHESEVEKQRTAVRLFSADSPEAKAAVVLAVHQQNQQRLAELEADKQELRQAVDDGTISASEYRARSAVLDVQIRSVERSSAQLERAAETLPLSVLISVGVDITEITGLRTDATDLRGTDLAAVAPSLDGWNDSVAPPTDPDDDGNNETVDDLSEDAATALTEAETEVQTARETVDEANETVDDAVVTGVVSELLGQAQHNLSVAEHALDEAYAADDEKEYEEAIELANEATDYARNATDLAEEVIELTTDGSGL